ncbi:hypothetical protein P692DRAFT_201812022 [Suillus brevipes Sb2]|nr:hypothetical protein P692DRAFT_201812022 [Suillus brevipes Sb2]
MRDIYGRLYHRCKGKILKNIKNVKNYYLYTSGQYQLYCFTKARPGQFVHPVPSVTSTGRRKAPADLKELLDERNCIVACEEPPIITHSPYCTDNTACFIDWRQLWWNSIARFLLDGHNPQKFHEAIECFQELGPEIGRVNLECWKMLLQTVKKVTAFCLTFDLIEETAQQLSAALITEPALMLMKAELDTLGLPSHEEIL